MYTWGNREGYDREDDPVEPGTLITKGESAVVDGQRFTCEPTDVGTEDILITHPLYRQLLDNFDGLAYFSGHVHAGRVRNKISVRIVTPEARAKSVEMASQGHQGGKITVQAIAVAGGRRLSPAIGR